ncbi:hypothetical protein ABA45_11810 [Marinobacter psychrophilus]|uniref:Uncharacterized protein n=1 Tax=Marinobacter psychrophilus TaxID=330734 RepID=A0A0H4IDC2_9GAMM|nr:hypothetical protein ABA45_11810 [Marinobacter psychrophilus]
MAFQTWKKPFVSWKPTIGRNRSLSVENAFAMLEIGPIGFPKLETDSTRKQLRNFGNGFYKDGNMKT